MTTKRRHRDLVPGAAVSAWLGPRPIWSGFLREPDWTSGEFVAEGLARQAESVPCLTGAGVTTTTPDTAIDNGIAKGWLDWSRVSSFSSAALVEGDSTDNLNSVDDLLSAYSEDQGRYWTLDPRAIIHNPLQRKGMTPAAGFWDVIVEGDRLGTSEEKLAGTVVARYADSGSSGLKKTVIVPATGGELPVVKVDLTNRGPITTAKSTATAQAILDSAAAQVGLLGTFEVTRNQIVGRPNLAMVTAGHRFRLRGQHAPSGLSASPVCTADQSRWTVAEGTVLITPLGAPQRDLESIIETAGVAA
ncbi:MAG TPA: hypothetical protein VIP28_00100 [Nocardioides sp.]